MSDQPKPVIYSGQGTRIAEMLWAECLRFQAGTGLSERCIWRLQFTTPLRSSSAPAISVDATPAALRELARWCEKMADCVQTDGGRSGGAGGTADG